MTPASQGRVGEHRAVVVSECCGDGQADAARGCSSVDVPNEPLVRFTTLVDTVSSVAGLSALCCPQPSTPTGR